MEVVSVTIQEATPSPSRVRSSPVHQRWITRQVEIIDPPRKQADPAEVGYDLVFPIGPGDRDQWMQEIDVIFLPGVPRGLREGGWVYLMQGRDIFFSAPIEEIVADADRISWITGADHGDGPSMIVDLKRGKRHRIDATSIPTPDGQLWHNRRGIKYVTPGCREFVRLGPKPPLGAMKARSSPEVALERALAHKLPVDRGARRLRVHDGALRPTIEVDICVPSLTLVIEYDGSWWHRGREKRDKAKTDRLRAAGLRVIRVRDELPVLDTKWDIAVDRSWTPDDMARAIVAICSRHRVIRARLVAP